MSKATYHTTGEVWRLAVRCSCGFELAAVGLPLSEAQAAEMGRAVAQHREDAPGPHHIVLDVNMGEFELDQWEAGTDD